MADSRARCDEPRAAGHARVTERTWLQVWVDGKSVLAENVLAGQNKSFTADQSVKMRVGNAGGLDVTVNGVPQGKLGSTGQVLDASWDIGRT